MATTFNVLLFIFALKSSTGSPVGQLPVESRLEQLELGAEVQYERTNALEQRLSVLEQFVVGMLTGSDNSHTGNATLTNEEIEYLLRNYSQASGKDYFMPNSPVNGALRQFQAPKVAFHAYMTGNHNLSPDNVVVFEQPEINDGSAYAPTVGIFDAPTSGTYVFTWTITALKFARPVTTRLVVDGKEKGVLTSESDFSTTNVAGTGSHPATAVVVTHVNAGEHVFIRVSSSNGETSSIQSDALSRSSFSGWLL